jgi:hypothetical protein
LQEAIWVGCVLLLCFSVFSIRIGGIGGPNLTKKKKKKKKKNLFSAASGCFLANLVGVIFFDFFSFVLVSRPLGRLFYF